MELASCPHPDTVDQILEVLRDHGVTHFACPAFSVTLGAAPVPESEAFAAPGELIKVRTAESVRGLYANPALWPGGVPPQFPKKES